MTKKELIQNIKNKSKAIELPDFSASIIEKAKHLPKQEMIEKPRALFRLKPYYLATLGVMLSVVMVILFTPNQPIDPINPSLENMEEVIAFSTLTSVSLIQTLDQDVSSETGTVNLSHGNPPAPKRIENQIPDITKYLDMIEKLFGSNPGFDLVIEDRVDPSYQQRMRFKSKDLINQEIDYAIDFNQTTIGVHGFLIEGVVIIGEYLYPMYAEGSANDINTLTLEIEQTSGGRIIILYTKDVNLHTFEIKMYQNNLLTQEVYFTYQEMGTDKRATLDFIQGETIGSYTFQLDVEDNIKLIRITYDLNSEHPESGEIVIRIRTLLGEVTYVILVKPDGGIPFIINRERNIRPMYGNPHMNSTNFAI
jgi:hypothetical protein